VMVSLFSPRTVGVLSWFSTLKLPFVSEGNTGELFPFIAGRIEGKMVVKATMQRITFAQPLPHQ
jgi:hypothetical protein